MLSAFEENTNSHFLLSYGSVPQPLVAQNWAGRWWKRLAWWTLQRRCVCIWMLRCPKLPWEPPPSPGPRELCSSRKALSGCELSTSTSMDLMVSVADPSPGLGGRKQLLGCSSLRQRWGDLKSHPSGAPSHHLIRQICPGGPAWPSPLSKKWLS